MKAPAHRPSRRDDIVTAAVRVFARAGLVDAGVQDVADEIGVASTAVYYHFESKDALLSAALRSVLERIHDVVQTARPDGTPADDAALDRVIDAVEAWIDQHPDEARLFRIHLGAAGEARQVRDEFDRLHTARALDYLPKPAGGTVRAQTVHALSHALAVRTLISALTQIAALEGADGPFADLPAAEVKLALRTLAHRIVSGG